MKDRLVVIRIITVGSAWLAVCLAVVLSPAIKVLKGNSDFLAQYTAGRLLLQGLGSHLYDQEVQKQVQEQVLASLNSDVRFADGLLLFSHPPFVAVSYAPFASLPYLAAYLVWSALSGICFTVGLAQLIRHFGFRGQRDFELIVLACVLCLPLAVTLWQGQTTGIAFLFLVMAFLGLKKAFDFRAGLYLSLALVKFQLLPATLLILFLKRRWQALLGFSAGGLALLFLSWSVVSLGGLSDYVKLLCELPAWVGRYGVNPIGAQCIRGQMFLLLYDRLPGMVSILTLLADAALICVLLRCWKGEWRPESELFDLRFALLVVVGLLVAPLVNFHDLAFLLLPGLIIFHYARAGSGAAQRGLRLTFLIVSYPLQLLTFTLPLNFPLQNNVIGLLILVGAIAIILWRKEPSEAAAHPG